jgi:hypothetical protein
MKIRFTINNFIRKLTFVLLVSISVVNIVAGQSNAVQREIQAISNDQLIGLCQGIMWKVALVSEMGDRVVKQALKLPYSAERDSITTELVSLLTDTTKGIAVHFVLCAIWKKRVPFGSTSMSHTPGLIECTYADLTFYQLDGKTYATVEELRRNQNNWRNFLRQ